MPWVQVSAVDGGAAAEFTEHALRSASAPVTLGDASKWDAHVETKQQIFDDLDQGSGEWTRTLVKRGLLKRAAGHMARGRGDSREAVASLFVKARRHPWLAARIAGPRCQFDEAERDAIAGWWTCSRRRRPWPSTRSRSSCSSTTPSTAAAASGTATTRRSRRRPCGAARWLGAVDAAVRLPPPRLRFGASVLEEVCVFATGKRPRGGRRRRSARASSSSTASRPARRRGGRRRSSTATPSRPPRARSTRSATSSSTRRGATTTTPADGDDDDSDADARTDDALGAAALLDALERHGPTAELTARQRASRRGRAAAAEDPRWWRELGRDRRDACSERCPGAWRCPITHDIMRDPVLVVESVGNTYERRAIEAWFAPRPLTDPKSGLPVSSSVVVPNLLLASLIRDWCEKCARAAASDDDDDDSDPRKTSDDEDVA
ncbi:ubiquitin-protein transferase [Aureococcus anophagefferens]|nr:ubiquitin-protein transferase [Aureococcus anophagefferens]